MITVILNSCHVVLNMTISKGVWYFGDQTECVRQCGKERTKYFSHIQCFCMVLNAHFQFVIIIVTISLKYISHKHPKNFHRLSVHRTQHFRLNFSLSLHKTQAIYPLSRWSRRWPNLFTKFIFTSQFMVAHTQFQMLLIFLTVNAQIFKSFRTAFDALHLRIFNEQIHVKRANS